jgi:hypothetical protein
MNYVIELGNAEIYIECEPGDTFEVEWDKNEEATVAYINGTPLMLYGGATIYEFERYYADRRRIYSEAEASQHPTKQELADEAGDIKYHTLKEDGKIE